jgi:hypothetical protein
MFDLPTAFATSLGLPTIENMGTPDFCMNISMWGEGTMF